MVGQLTELFGLPEIFRITSLASAAIGFISVLLYYLIGKKRELVIVERLNRDFPDRFSEKPESIPVFSGRQAFAEMFDTYHVTSM